MKVNKLENSEIIEIGPQVGPFLGVVGMVHGNETCGRQVMEEFIREFEQYPMKRRIKFIFANLAAEKSNKRFIDSNLNRVFPGRIDGDLEERTAYSLRPHLAECAYVLDIHSMSYPTRPFAVSSFDSREQDNLVVSTAMPKYIIVGDKVTKGGGLCDYVIAKGGLAIAIETGLNSSEESVFYSRMALNSFFTHFGIIPGAKVCMLEDKYRMIEQIKQPSPDFEPALLENFQFLQRGESYGKDNSQEYSLEYDCYVGLFSDKMVEGDVFVSMEKDNRLL